MTPDPAGKPDYRKYTFAAAIVAAVLAVIAGILQYAKSGTINPALIASALFMTALAFGMRRAPRSR